MATISFISRDKVTLTLTRAEARGLAKLAGEGASGILSDPVAARDWIGAAASVAAARRALAALGGCVDRQPEAELFRMRNKKKGRLSPPSVSREKGSKVEPDQA